MTYRSGFVKNDTPKLGWLAEMGYATDRPLPQQTPKRKKETYAQRILNPKPDGYVEPTRRKKPRGHTPKEVKQCCYCGKQISGKQVTRDHIHPKHKGGTTTRPRCKTCNQFKGGDTLDEFIARLKWCLEQAERLAVDDTGSL